VSREAFTIPTILTYVLSLISRLRSQRLCRANTRGRIGGSNAIEFTQSRSEKSSSAFPMWYPAAEEVQEVWRMHHSSASV